MAHNCKNIYTLIFLTYIYYCVYVTVNPIQSVTFLKCKSLGITRNNQGLLEIQVHFLVVLGITYRAKPVTVLDN